MLQNCKSYYTHTHTALASQRYTNTFRKFGSLSKHKLCWLDWATHASGRKIYRTISEQAVCKNWWHFEVASDNESGQQRDPRLSHADVNVVYTPGSNCYILILFQLLRLPMKLLFMKINYLVCAVRDCNYIIQGHVRQHRELYHEASRIATSCI